MEKYWLWLSLLPGVGVVLQRKLLEKFGSPVDIYHAGEGELAGMAGLQRKQRQHLLMAHSLEQAVRVQEAVQKAGARLLCLTDPLYPALVRNLPAAPPVLYYRGTLREQSCGVGIVGARRCTDYGKEVAREAAAFLAEQGVPVISGMARGIDGYANTACLQAGGYTLAFLGCGVDICYPAEHRELMEEIVRCGAVISAYPPGTKALPAHFPRRNYLISGWSYRLLVVEAAPKSGSLITARLSRQLGRPVLAVPNSIYSRESAGTNALIATGLARLYRHPQQLLQDDAITTKTMAKKNAGSSAREAIKTATAKGEAPEPSPSNLTSPAREIIAALQRAGQPLSSEELAARVPGEKKTFWETLALMILEGTVESLPGDRIQPAVKD